MKHIATTHLHAALVELVETGHHIPCLLEPDLWLSDNAQDRATAARLCANCPVLAECAAAAKEVKTHFGVWAAHDYTRPQGQHATPVNV